MATVAPAKEDQASLVIAMIIPISTHMTIAICSQIQVGDIAPGSLSTGATGLRRRNGSKRGRQPGFVGQCTECL
jgi:hypothetical protein